MTRLVDDVWSDWNEAQRRAREETPTTLDVDPDPVQNLDVFGFELGLEDMVALSALARGDRAAPGRIRTHSRWSLPDRTPHHLAIMWVLMSGRPVPPGGGTHSASALIACRMAPRFDVSSNSAPEEETTMTDELGGRERPRTPATPGRRFKPHELELADGGRLVLGVDGSIDRIDKRGSMVHRWTPDDPAWPDQAIRFGLHPQARTATPHGQVQGSKPPRR